MNIAGAETAPDTPPASPQAALCVLTKRSDFLKAARARRQAAPAFLLQARRRGAEEPAAGVRIGYTCSKKVGNAVARNRAKRRLREIARLELAAHGQPGWDYVLIGRRDATATRAFEDLCRDLRTAITRIHAPRQGRAPHGKAPRSKGTP